MPGAPVIARVGPQDWRLLRDVRLRALADSPAAFASDLARESGFEEATWRSRAVSGATFVASTPEVGLGLATGLGAGPVRDLVSMWVAPACRGTGLAERVVAAVVGWARDDGATALDLDVALDNARAIGFYRRLGFRSTGRRQPFPGRPLVQEEQYRLSW